jgi:hypothetical protein
MTVLKLLLVRLGLRAAILLFLVALFIVFAFMRFVFVPPIWIKVVDASTGKPVAGVNVCLEVGAKDWHSGETLRIVSTQTDSSGNLWISPSIHWLSLFESSGGYTIRINDSHLNIDTKLDTYPVCGEPHVAITVTESQVPIFTSSDWPVYFPVTLVKQPTHQLPTSYSYSREMVFPLGSKVPLVPFLKSRDACQPTKDPTWAAYCKVENNSWLADQLRARANGIDAQ